MGGETVPLLPLPGQYGTAWGGGEAQGAGLWLQGKVISGVSLFLCFVSMFSLLPARAIIFLLLIIHSVVDIPAAFLVPVCRFALHTTEQLMEWLKRGQERVEVRQTHYAVYLRLQRLDAGDPLCTQAASIRPR